MDGYICFYRGKAVEVFAKTQLEARDKGVIHFRTKKPWMVTAVLAEKDGKQITHSPGIL